MERSQTSGFSPWLRLIIFPLFGDGSVRSDPDPHTHNYEYIQTRQIRRNTYRSSRPCSRPPVHERNRDGTRVGETRELLRSRRSEVWIDGSPRDNPVSCDPEKRTESRPFDVIGGDPRSRGDIRGSESRVYGRSPTDVRDPKRRVTPKHTLLETDPFARIPTHIHTTMSEKVTCGYCETELEKSELHEHPDGLECPICGSFAVGACV